MTNEFNLEFLIVSIEELCKQRKMSVKSVLEDCGLKRVVVDNMKKGSVPSIDKIFTLANYFDVSVDYLLGRTNEPKGINQINTGNVGDNSSVNINHAEKEKTSSDSDDTVSELVSVFKTLSLGDKAKVMSLIDELNNERK